MVKGCARGSNGNNREIESQHQKYHEPRIVATYYHRDRQEHSQKTKSRHGRVGRRDPHKQGGVPPKPRPGRRVGLPPVQPLDTADGGNQAMLAQKTAVLMQDAQKSYQVDGSHGELPRSHRPDHNDTTVHISSNGSNLETSSKDGRQTDLLGHQIGIGSALTVEGVNTSTSTELSKRVVSRAVEEWWSL